MTTNISEKSFKELNTLMSEVNVQIEELNITQLQRLTSHNHL